MCYLNCTNFVEIRKDKPGTSYHHIFSFSNIVNLLTVFDVTHFIGSSSICPHSVMDSDTLLLLLPLLPLPLLHFVAFCFNILIILQGGAKWWWYRKWYMWEQLCQWTQVNRNTLLRQRSNEGNLSNAVIKGRSQSKESVCYEQAIAGYSQLEKYIW